MATPSFESSFTAPFSFWVEILLRFDEWVEQPEFMGRLMAAKDKDECFVHVEFKSEYNDPPLEEGKCRVWGKRFWDIEYSNIKAKRKRSHIESTKNCIHRENLERVAKLLKNDMGMSDKFVKKFLRDNKRVTSETIKVFASLGVLIDEFKEEEEEK